MSEFIKALEEIGVIKPWWSEENNFYMFEHELYPFVSYLDKTPEQTISGYKKILKMFIAERRKGRVALEIDKATKGKGGSRPNAGRPMSPPSIRISLDKRAGDFLNSKTKGNVVKRALINTDFQESVLEAAYKYLRSKQA